MHLEQTNLKTEVSQMQKMIVTSPQTFTLGLKEQG